MSISGSEDGWNGEPPAVMNGQDVYDLAGAAGRQGREFEERAERHRGQAQNAPSNKEAQSAPRTSQSMFVKRPRSPQLGESSKTPINQFQFAPYGQAAPPVENQSPLSATSAAISAFIEAKRGQKWTPDDFETMDHLTNHLKAENGATPSKAEMRLGGWSAGEMTPSRSIKGLSASMSTPNGFFTPARPDAPFGSANSSFSFSAMNSPSAKTYKQHYFGPGMSPRRMLKEKGSRGGLKPLFNFNTSDADEQTAKKRKVALDDEPMKESESQVDDDNSGIASMSSSTPIRESSSRSAFPTARPHPLSQSTTAEKKLSSPKPQTDAEAVGKKRAADIMKELIETELGIIPPSPANSNSTPAAPVVKTDDEGFLLINPYDRSPVNAKGSTPQRSPSAFDSPRRSALKSSIRKTPARGAAAKLEANRSSRPLTPLERITGVKPVSSTSRLALGDMTVLTGPQWETQNGHADQPAHKHVRIETPTHEKDNMEVDFLISESPSKSSSSGAPASLISVNGKASTQNEEDTEDTAKETAKKTLTVKAAEPEPQPFAPIDVPVLETTQRPIPSFRVNSTYNSPMSQQKMSFETSSKTPVPTFSLSKAVPAQNSVDEDYALDIRPSKPKEAAFDPKKIYFTAQETAMQVDTSALPFFTFSLAKSSADDNHKEAKSEALKSVMEEYTFTMSEKPKANGTTTPSASWTCSLCMLSNAATAAEKCTICEAPKPAPATAKPAATAAPWTCSLCMLSNPATATEKCQICEAPKPVQSTSKPSSASARTPAPFQMMTFAGPPKVAGEWSCGECGLKNPATATEQCTICEAKRDHSTAPASTAPTMAPAAQWTCDLCSLVNPATATEKCGVCEAPKPATNTTAPTTSSFNWAAARGQ